MRTCTFIGRVLSVPLRGCWLFLVWSVPCLLAVRGLAAPRTPLPPLPDSSGPVLFHESFDATYSAGSRETTLVFPNFGTLRESWTGMALERSGPVTSYIVPALAPDGHTNIASQTASAVRFWLTPHWASPLAGGAGPGHEATLLELVATDGQDAATVWSLRTTRYGSALMLIARGQAGSIELLRADLAWGSSAHCLAVNFGPEGTALFVDGALAAQGAGTLPVPPKVAALAFGSTWTGDLAAEADLDEIYVFGRPVTEAAMAFYYSSQARQAALGPVSQAEWQAQHNLAANLRAQRAAALASAPGGGAQTLRLLGPTSTCLTNVSVHLTNLVCTFDTNAGWTVTFDIQGGTNGLLYDVFTTTNLTGNSITNAPWTWLERGPTCSTYQYTNLAGTYAFYVLGTPQDSDNDGLTDAYEKLVSHTGTNIWDDIDSDNDGLSDAWEIATGLSPNTAECPRDIYEARIQSQNPYAWFKLNGTNPTPDAASLADARGGAALVIPTSPLATTGSFTADLFDKAHSAFAFDDGTNGLETVRDVISGGTGNDQGSASLLFRSLTGAATGKRYVFSQRATPSTNEFAVYFDTEGLRLQIGGRTNVILQTNGTAYGAWYYLAITWDETRPSTNGAEVNWYLGRVGGTLASGSTNIPDTAVVGSTNTVCIGCRRNNDDSWSPFRSPGKGALDQIAFWNRELTAGEITAQFNALPPGWLPTNFNWELMLPVNEAGQLVPNDPPHVVEHAPLVAGFQFVDCTKKYFYRGASNSLVFEAPWNGADTDTSSNSPRSELRETLANGDQHNWAPNSEGGTHTLQASCKVLSGTNKVVIGQIHAKTPNATNDSGAVPAVILSHNPSNGVLTVTVKHNPEDKIADSSYNFDTPVPLGETINYTLQMVGAGTNVTLNATVNNQLIPIEMTQPPYDPRWGATNVTLYFKAGCYYPKAPTNSGTAKVTFSSLTVTPHP